MLGIDTFGCSGRKDDVLEHVHFDYDSILHRIEQELGIASAPAPQAPQQPQETLVNEANV